MFWAQVIAGTVAVLVALAFFAVVLCVLWDFITGGKEPEE